MPLFETESLILKTYNLAEADRIVVFLTRDHGLVRGVAKGAKRLKSKFGSGLEPFSIVRIEYFQKDSVELVSIQKAELVQSNFAAAGNPDFLQKFSYLAELVLAIAPPHDPNETLYRMAKACTEAGAGAHDLTGIGVYFELWLLRLAGYMPDWARCEVCARRFEEDEDTALRQDFQLVCLNCRRSAADGPLTSRVRLLVNAARRQSPSEFASDGDPTLEHLNILSAILKQIISRSIGRQIPGETSLAVNT